MLNKSLLRSSLLSLEAVQLQQSRRAYAEHLQQARRDPTEPTDHDQASHEFASAKLAEYFEGPLHSYEAGMQRLRNIDFGPKVEVEEGAAVRIAGRWYVVGVATQAFECDGLVYMGISTAAPIYKAIAGAKAGETVEFGVGQLLIEEVA